MKELSIEEKAKAYDEAIERGSRLWESDTITRESYEYIFPEVKESEDERIRGAIIEHLKDNNLIEWASWLEKHGSCQNDVNYNIAENEDERIKKVLVGFFKSYKEQGTCGAETFNGIPTDDILSWLEKHGEQKPADETPYPETLEKAIDLYYYSYGNGEGEFEHLSLEKFRDIVHTFISDYGQKSSWSEEDEAHIESVLKRLKGICKPGAAFIPTRFAISEDEYWLKGLKERYTWKPNDEYIQALDEVYKTHGANNVCRHILLNLMNDLKKLKE